MKITKIIELNERSALCSFCRQQYPDVIKGQIGDADICKDCILQMAEELNK